MADGISIREFARRDGCSDTLVRRALKDGHLTAFGDGTIDAALVGTGWRSANRRGANPANSGANSSQVRTAPVRSAQLAAGESPDEAAERILGELGPFMAIAEAERLKENYLALLRQLEYDLKSGQVVLVAEVVKAVAAEYARVRTRLLAIPAEQAPRLFQCQTVVEVQDLLQAVVAEALEELTRDGAGAAG